MKIPRGNDEGNDPVSVDEAVMAISIGGQYPNVRSADDL